MPSDPVPSDFYGYFPADPHDTADAGRSWWDGNARDYLAEHGEFLGDVSFCWGPEGLREQDAGLLGPMSLLREQQVLEIGAGGAQCSRWLAAQGVNATATDVSSVMIDQAREINERTGVHVPVAVADARELPFTDDSFDVVFTAYGAIPFVAELDLVHREVARVLRPGGRWVFSVTHPFRWCFPDVPGVAGLTANRSYFSTDPYVETDGRGNVTYAEYHRTVGGQVRSLVAAGFELLDLVEPEWPQEHDQVWGGWSPQRGALVPGTAIFVARSSDTGGEGSRY